MQKKHHNTGPVRNIIRFIKSLKNNGAEIIVPAIIIFILSKNPSLNKNISDVVFLSTTQVIQIVSYPIQSMFEEAIRFSQYHAQRKDINTLLRINQEFYSEIEVLKKQLDSYKALERVINTNFLTIKHQEIIAKSIGYLGEDRTRILIKIIDKEQSIPNINNLVINHHGLVGKISDIKKEDGQVFATVDTILYTRFRIPSLSSKTHTNMIIAGNGLYSNPIIMHVRKSDTIEDEEKVFSFSGNGIILPEILIGSMKVDQNNKKTLHLAVDFDKITYVKILKT